MGCNAPPQLPLAPPPYLDELLSSWLLRVAAANSVALVELLAAFEAYHPHVFRRLKDLDYALPEGAVRAIAFSCRVAPKEVRGMDLLTRAPHLESAWVLRFSRSGREDARRCRPVRARYAYCPLCLETPPLRIRWDWCLAGVIRCPQHHVSLREGCAHCAEDDPVDLAPSGLDCVPRCRSCGELLADSKPRDALHIQPALADAVADAYRAALRGVAPSPRLFGQTSDRQFRQFVNDMLEILGHDFLPETAATGQSDFARHDLLAIIAQLIRNAAPSAGRNKARGVVLWPTLLRLLPPERGAVLESKMDGWPPHLRRSVRGVIRRRLRWADHSFAREFSGPRSKFRRLAAVQGLARGDRSRSG